MAFFKRKAKETGSEPVDEHAEDRPSPVVDSKEVSESPEVVAKDAKVESPNNKKVVYVVSTHPDGGWQVKRAGSTKAIKRFDTKAEADAYAKKVASNNGASVLRKKKDGKIQKKR